MSSTKKDGPADGETMEEYFTRKAEEEAAISLRASMADLESGRRVANAVNFNEGGELLNPSAPTPAPAARSLKLDLAPVALEEKSSTARTFSVDHHHDDEDWEHKMHMVAEARAQFQRLRADVGVELSQVEGDGVRISALLPEGAASRAGLRVGDVIDHVNFKETNDVEDFTQALQSILAGDSVPFEIVRTAFGNTLQLTVVVQTGAKGMSADQLRQLRATASGHVDDADARERRNKSEQGPLALNLGMTSIEHDDEHDQDWDLKQQLVAEARARFSSLVPWVGCEFTHSDKGVKLTAIQAGGAAQAAGLQVGDVIEQINFHDTKNRDQFDFAVASILAGDSVPFRIERDGKESNLIVIVGAVGMSHSEVRHLRVVASGKPDEADLKDARHRRDHDLPAGVGLGAIEHHDDDWETRAHIVAEARSKLSGLKADLGVATAPVASGGEGLVVTKVVAGGSAYLAGVQPGDIIDHINFTEVSSAEDFTSSLSAVFPGDNVPVQLTRGTTRLNLVIAAAADGVPLQSVRDLRRIASGQVSEHDLREHKQLESSLPVTAAPVLHGILHGDDLAQDDEAEARAQLVATSRARFSALKADVGVELEEVTGGTVRISKLVAGGGAESAGVRIGDTIDHVNFAETSTIEEFHSALSSVLPGDSVPFQLHRAGGERATLVVQAGAAGITAGALRDLRRLAAGVVHDHDLHHSS